eukprot:GHVL01018394.1.p1 GENE.GHVL01018394.1~~GHVL01018394.1.p1  ORF type:complete len:356 (-),score=70.33 GHVL01018394.1:1051-2118(-)
MTTNAMMLIMVWSFNGIFQSACYPNFVALISDWFSSDSRCSVLGIWCTSQQIGSIIWTIFASWIAAKFSWRAAFICPSIIVACCGILLYLYVKESKKDIFNYEESSFNNIQVDKLKNYISPKIGVLPVIMTVAYQYKNTMSLKQLVKVPLIINVACANFFIKLIRYTLLFWLPYFLHQYMGYDSKSAGFVSIVFDIGGILGSIITGWMADNVFQGKRLSTAACLCLGTGVSLMVLVWSIHINVYTTCLGIMLVGFMIAGPDCILGATASLDLIDRARLPHHHATAAAGFINGVGSIGAILQGFLTATIAEIYGWDTLFGMLCLFAIIALILLFPAIIADSKDTRRIATNNEAAVH